MRSRSNYDRYLSLGAMEEGGCCRNITNMFSFSFGGMKQKRNHG